MKYRLDYDYLSKRYFWIKEKYWKNTPYGSIWDTSDEFGNKREKQIILLFEMTLNDEV